MALYKECDLVEMDHVRKQYQTGHAPSQHQPVSKVGSATDAKAKEFGENPEFDPLENDFRHQ
jgi:hypothetical protein